MEEKHNAKLAKQASKEYQSKEASSEEDKEEEEVEGYEPKIAQYSISTQKQGEWTGGGPTTSKVSYQGKKQEQRRWQQMKNLLLQTKSFNLLIQTDQLWKRNNMKKAT